MPDNDPVCLVCGEPKSSHVSTDAGPLTHPKEARGEGHYVKITNGYTLSGCMGKGPGYPDIEVPPAYEFRPGRYPPNSRG